MVSCRVMVGVSVMDRVRVRVMVSVMDSVRYGFNPAYHNFNLFYH